MNGSGLRYPADLAAWQAWQTSRTPLRAVVRRIRPTVRPPGVLDVFGPSPQVLVVLDSTAPTSLLALLKVTPHLSAAFAVLFPAPLPNGRAGSPQLLDTSVVPEALRSVRVVASTGHFLPRGAIGLEWARRLGAEFVAVQHGLLTPHAPPLAPDSHLLAWSSADADFWRSGRPDVQTRVVGSQLLWEAGLGHTHVTDDRPTFLGQLHSAEMGRHEMARFTAAFCRAEDTRYRHILVSEIASPGGSMRAGGTRGSSSTTARCRCASCRRRWSAFSRRASSRPQRAACPPGRRTTTRLRGSRSSGSGTTCPATAPRPRPRPHRPISACGGRGRQDRGPA